MKYIHVIVLLALLWLFACTGNEKSKNQSLLHLNRDTLSAPFTIRYARGFEVNFYENFKIVKVPFPYRGANKPKVYLLKNNKDVEIPQVEVDAEIIIPVERIASTSTTHLPFIELLDAEKTLVGFSDTKFITSEEFKERVKDDEIAELGPNINLNTELLMALNPDVLMAYLFEDNPGAYAQFEKVNIPVVFTADYLERHPLGRAEWIKFISLFFNREKMADSIFRKVEMQYLKARKMALNAEGRPSVISGLVYGNAWYMPGGESWPAKYFQDAGANFLWSENDEFGSIPLSFERVYEKGHDAEYWIGVGDFKSLAALNQQDARYSNFRAFNLGNVYANNARNNETGGNDFFEQGVARPDIVLRDLVKIFHASLLPDHQLYFYRKLSAD